MEILCDKIIKFKNIIDTELWIDLIENVSNTSYPFQEVIRRPHLTMELPIVFDNKDNYDSIKLRHMIYSIATPCFMEYMKQYNNFDVRQFKNYITVSKLLNDRFSSSSI